MTTTFCPSFFETGVRHSFGRNNGQVFIYSRKHGPKCTKMGADSLTENTPNAPKFISLICLSKPECLGFEEKWLHWATVVRVFNHTCTCV